MQRLGRELTLGLGSAARAAVSRASFGTPVATTHLATEQGVDQDYLARRCEPDDRSTMERARREPASTTHRHDSTAKRVDA
jgi:hypothetical protein